MKTNVTLTVNEILQLGLLFREFDNWGAGGKVEPLAEQFVQALVDNLIAVGPTLQAYQLLDEKGAEYNAYKKARIELDRTHARKDPKGTPLSVNGRYIPENMAEHELAQYELTQHYAAVIAARQAKLDEVVALGFTTVERRFVPRQGISISALAKLAVFVVPDLIVEPTPLKVVEA